MPQTATRRDVATRTLTLGLALAAGLVWGAWLASGDRAVAAALGTQPVVAATADAGGRADEAR
jgi:hypothetical protein